MSPISPERWSITHVSIYGCAPPMCCTRGWVFEKQGRKWNVRVNGPLVFNSIDLPRDAGLTGFGLAYLPVDQESEFIEDGRLIRVLEDWCSRLSGSTCTIRTESRQRSSHCWSKRCDKRAGHFGLGECQPICRSWPLAACYGRSKRTAATWVPLTLTDNRRSAVRDPNQTETRTGRALHRPCTASSRSPEFLRCSSSNG